MNQSLSILITCRDFSLRGGSQLYTRDVALRLKELGHRPIIFSPNLGKVATEVRARGIPVISDLDQLGQTPDVVHGQHHLETVAALLRFPTAPGIFVCHGWLPWQEAPPRLPSIGKYVAVDAIRQDRLVMEHGIAPEDVEVIHNFVDIDRFLPRAPVPEKPRRALLFSNQATTDNFGAVVRRVCVARSMTLDIAGQASGLVLDAPEEVLGDYDLVFARGRSALEAMAVGSGVVLCDVEGVGPFVDSSNFESLRDRNFGVGALRSPLNDEELTRQIDRFSSVEALRVQQIVRSRCGRNEAVDRLIAVYHAALSRRGATDPGEMLTAASRYLSWLGPFTERAVEEAVAHAHPVQQPSLEREEKLGGELETAVRRLEELPSRMAETFRFEQRSMAAETERVRLQAALDASSARRLQLESEIDALGEKLRVAGSESSELRNMSRSLKADLTIHRERLERANESLEVLQKSPFSKARARLLDSSALVRIYRLITGRGRTLR